MIQSSFDQESSRRLHVAIVMDGNGRWAEARGLPRLAGARRGIRAPRRIVEAAPGLGIGTLTLFAFSSDNWKRPRSEVDGLMALLGSFLRRETATLAAQDVRLSLIGRRDRLPLALGAAVTRAETETAGARGLHLRLAVDYSARDMILRAARWRLSGSEPREAFAARLGHARRRPADPHGRRAASERFPALGKCLRRAPLRVAHVAGLRPRRSGRGPLPL